MKSESLLVNNMVANMVVKGRFSQFRDFTLSRVLGEVIEFTYRILMEGHVLA